MSSKLLKKGSEMYGKSKGPADMGLKASGGSDRIAAVSEDKRRGQGAPKR